MSRLSVITDSISNDLERAIEVIALAGLSAIELQSVWGKPLSDLSNDEVERIRTLVVRAGLRVCCLSQKNLFGAMPVGQVEIGDAAFEKQMAAMRRIIEIARVLDTDLLRIMCFRKEMILFGHNGAENAVVTKGAWDKFVELMRPPVKLAEESGIRLAVENSTKGMITSAYLARKLIDTIGSPALKVLWDPCNAFYFNETAFPDGYEQLKGGYLAHLHIKDGIADIPKATVTFKPLGEGQMGPHLQDLADALARDCYDGFVSMESLYRPENGSAEDGFHASLDTAKRYFG